MTSVILLVAAAALVAVLLMSVLPRLLLVCSPNEAIIVSGLRSPGARHGYRVIRGGRTLRLPLLERADSIDLSNYVVSLDLERVYLRNLLPVALRIVGNVKVDVLTGEGERAIAMWLGRSRDEIAEVLAAVFEGTVRAVVAHRSLREVQQDPVKLQHEILEQADHDLRALGFIMDTASSPRVALDGFAPGDRDGLDAAADASGLPATEDVADPLAFLPEASLHPSLNAPARSASGGGPELEVNLSTERLEIREGGGAGVATVIAFDRPFTVMLGQSAEAGGVRAIHVDVRQERAGSSIRLGLSASTGGFSASVGGLPVMQPRFPRISEEHMLSLLAGLRTVMRNAGGERWGGEKVTAAAR